MRFVSLPRLSRPSRFGGASAQTKLLRFPDIHKDKVVFTYAGDLWTASLDRRHGDPADRPSRASSCSPSSRRTASGSPSPASTTATSRSTSSRRPAARRSSSPSIPPAARFPPRWGYDNQVYGWTTDGKSVVFRSLRDGWDPGDSRIYTVSDGRRSRRGPADARVRRRRPSRRTASRWSTPRSPATSAPGSATGRLGPGPLDLRPRHPRRRRRSPTPRAPSAIPCGSATRSISTRTARHTQPLLLRLGGRRDRPAHPQHAVGRPLAQRRPDGQIVYEMNGELNVFDTRSAARARAISITVPDDGLGTPPVAGLAPPTRSRTPRSRPKGERALFVARGDVFTAPIEKGADPQPDPLLGRARQVAALVARRPQDRLHLRPDRRGGALVVDAGRRRQARAAHHGRQGLPLRARVVAGRQAHRLQRQGRPPLRRHGRRPQADRDRRTPRAAEIRDYRGRRAATTWPSA